MRASSFLVVGTFGSCLALGLSPTGCETKEPQGSSYFSRSIAPILSTSCVRTNTGAGCHVADDKGNAFGNLDVASFDGINHRRDLLLDYGPYGQPAMLVKNVPPYDLQVQTFDGQKITVRTDIKHAGGPIFDPTASGYQTLRRWIANGATENNGGAPPSNLQRLPCSHDIPPGIAGFDASKDPTTPDFGTFRDRVNPTLGGTCAASNCHGSPANDLQLTCGDTPEQLRWNYFVATEYLAQTPELSEIVRRPLAPAQGGAFHEGGAIFTSTTDDGYQGILQWAKEHGPPQLAALDPGFAFFAHKVQPILVKKGCMMVQCHSAAMFHDYRLRGGSGGSFSLSATRKNYNLSLAQMALDSDDINASRIVRKNLYRPEVFTGSTGIAHRGGPLLEDFPGVVASGALCDAKMPPINYGTDDVNKIEAYCVLREWLRIERSARNLSGLSAIVYVRRPISMGRDGPQDFDVYQGGADLRRVAATLDAMGNVVPGADTSLTAGCGLTAASADIRRPSVSWDGKHIAFAARSSAGEPLQIYEMNADGTSCAKHADINGTVTMGNGLLVHNFDPAYSPPDAAGVVHIVFASTRGNLSAAAYGYDGPQRTPADPTKPNANLYVWDGPGKFHQLSYHLNMERQPSFMSDGRVIYTHEKREPGFAQLALRRVNLDGGDYHPLYAQRATIGYQQATQVVELADKNFAAIFGTKDAPHGGGTLGIFNRSLGIDFTSKNAADYVVDNTVIDPNSPTSPESAFFLHSLRVPDPTAPAMGVYLSPAALPGGKLLVSFGAAGGDFDVFVIDPSTGQKTAIITGVGTAEIEAVAVYARATRELFVSRLDEPNASVSLFPGRSEADLTVLDFPVLASLLFQNTPTGRPVDKDIGSFEIYEELPPTSDVTTFAAGGANVVKDDFGQVYVRRRLVGQVPVGSDGSTHFTIPGGVPILLHLPDTKMSADLKLPRWQRETMSFTPGEYTRQSFRRGFFNGFCGQCHGSISGKPLDVAMSPDILTQASAVDARGSTPIDLNKAPGDRGQPQGPPATP